MVEKMEESPKDKGVTLVVEKAEKPVKEKKPRSEAQLAAFQKGLEALKLKREAIKAEKEKMTEQMKQEKQDEQHQRYLKNRYEKKKKLPPIPEYVSKNDLEVFKKDLFDMVVKNTPRTIYQEVKVPVEKITPVVVEVPSKPTTVEKLLSGSSLLDKIFFN